MGAPQFRRQRPPQAVAAATRPLLLRASPVSFFSFLLTASENRMRHFIKDDATHKIKNVNETHKTKKMLLGILV